MQRCVTREVAGARGHASCVTQEVAGAGKTVGKDGVYWGVHAEKRSCRDDGWRVLGTCTSKNDHAGMVDANCVQFISCSTIGWATHRATPQGDTTG